MDFINKAAQGYMHQQQPGSQSSGPQYQPQQQGQGYPPHQPSPHPPGSPFPPQNPNHGLPPGWVEQWDASGNRYFYVNQRTGERTWNRPSAPPPGPHPSDPNRNLPPGWVAEWDAPDNRWFYVNQRTGERTWNRPAGPPPPAQYTEVHTSGRGPMGQSYQQTTATVTQAPQQKNHNLAYGAAGAVAGLAGGALLMHEGHKVEEHWERDKHKFEGDFDRHEYRDEERRGYGGGGYGDRGGDTIVENNTYVDDDRYGGGYRPGNDTIIENQTIINDDSYDQGYRPNDETIVQNETIVDDDRYGGGGDYDTYNETTTVVQDDGYGGGGYRGDDYRDDSFVDDAARWTGDKVQEVEDIPDDVENAFDEGRDDRRYEDDDY